MNIFIKIMTKFLLILILTIPVLSFSANLSFESTNKPFIYGQEFLLNLFLDTEGESLNAVEGKILLPRDFLEVKEVRDGNSFINFWIERPNNSVSNIVSFSGITPGGFDGQKLFLFSVVLKIINDGKATIMTEGLKVLLNDGNGTEAHIETLPYSFSISKKSSDVISNVKKQKDIEIPEDFRLSIGIDNNIFGGKSFLVFETQDKISGIDHYEVREGFWDKYLTAQSPHLLKYQTLDKKIYVKVVDKSGNTREVTFNPQNYVLWYRQFIIFAVLLMLVIIGILSKKKWLRFLQKQ